MYPVSPQAYDRAITVFSPDGRLFQVEYAKEAVRRGATAIGIVCNGGVALVAHKMSLSNLVVEESLKKIFILDEHMGATASGLIADARRLVDIGRSEAQKHRITYDEAPSVEHIGKHLCDLMQLYTQYGGIRPFGVSLLMAGIDEAGPHLFEAEPSGALTEYKADAIGAGKKEVEDFFEKEYKEGIELSDGIVLSLKALKKTTEGGEITAKMIDIGIVKEPDRKFEILGEEEVKKYLSKA